MYFIFVYNLVNKISFHFPLNCTRAKFTFLVVILESHSLPIKSSLPQSAQVSFRNLSSKVVGFLTKALEIEPHYIW